MSSIKSRKDPQSAVFALVKLFNDLHDAHYSAVSGSLHHRDRTGQGMGAFTAPSSSLLQVTADAATEITSSVSLVNDILGVMKVHFGDDSSHTSAHSHGPLTAVTASSLDGGLASAYGTLLVCSQSYAVHVTGSMHLRSDTTNILTGSLVGNQDAVNFMANQMKTVLNAHIASGPAVGRCKLV